jgi:hypothetical protein
MVVGWTSRGLPCGRVGGVFRDWSDATWAIEALERAGFEPHAVGLAGLGLRRLRRRRRRILLAPRGEQQLHVRKRLRFQATARRIVAWCSSPGDSDGS